MSKDNKDLNSNDAKPVLGAVLLTNSNKMEIVKKCGL